MTNTQTLTRGDLRAVFKELNIATKTDLEQFTTKEDLKALASKKDLARLEQSTKEGFAKTEEGFAKQEKKMQESLFHLERRLKLRMGKHRNEIFAMFGMLATSTPSRREFNELKLRADRSITSS